MDRLQTIRQITRAAALEVLSNNLGGWEYGIATHLNNARQSICEEITGLAQKNLAEILTPEETDEDEILNYVYESRDFDIDAVLTFRVGNMEMHYKSKFSETPYNVEVVFIQDYEAVHIVHKSVKLQNRKYLFKTGEKYEANVGSDNTIEISIVFKEEDGRSDYRTFTVPDYCVNRKLNLHPLRSYPARDND